MRLHTSVCRSGFQKKPLTLKSLLYLSIFLFLFSGCAEDTVDEGANCQTQLDNHQFQSVADNAGCSAYERGSAEMGLAGFLFENFIKDNAENDFPSVFSLTRTGCDIEGTDELVGDYNSSYQKSFKRAQYWTRTKPQAEGTTRSNEEVEISFFSTLGELIVQTYCEIDAGLDGTISDDDNSSFSRIDTGGSAAGSSELDSATNLQQIVSSGSPWLCDTTADSCRADSTYEGVWDKLSAAATTLCAARRG